VYPETEKKYPILPFNGMAMRTIVGKPLDSTNNPRI
jgi:hypothetical protein